MKVSIKGVMGLNTPSCRKLLIRITQLSYALYLNTIKDAGETEYLYQQMRVPPVENTLVLWPATYTHPHRGNVVYGDTAKYIITGWFYLE